MLGGLCTSVMLVATLSVAVVPGRVSQGKLVLGEQPDKE